MEDSKKILPHLKTQQTSIVAAAKHRFAAELTWQGLRAAAVAVQTPRAVVSAMWRRGRKQGPSTLYNHSPQPPAGAGHKYSCSFLCPQVSGQWGTAEVVGSCSLPNPWVSTQFRSRH